jgi:hypothetical protein
VNINTFHIPHSDEAFQAFRFETVIINTFHIPYSDEAFQAFNSSKSEDHAIKIKPFTLMFQNE